MRGKGIKRRGGRRAPKTTGTVPRPVRRYVSRMISAKTENKVWSNSGINQSLASTISQSTPASIGLMPLITKGSEESNRIGSQVTVKNAYVRGFVNLKPYDATTNPKPAPFWVKMWLCSSKNANNNTLSSNAFMVVDFFKTQSNSQGFVGNMTDLILSTNDEEVRIHKTKLVKLGAASYSTTGVINSGSYFDNSPAAAPFYFSLTKHTGKLQYSDNYDYPVNRNLFLVFQVVCMDGSTSGASAVPAEFHYNHVVQYEDA